MSAADQRPALFLSSTVSDLAEYRDVVIHVCQRLGIDVIAMEDFGPDPRTSVALCRAKLADADLFLGLYAHRYGHRPEGFDGKSITQLEYEWACERTPPPEILLFVIDDEHPWPGKFVERGDAGERLERFKTLMLGRHVVSKLTTPEQLKDDLFVHLPKFRDRSVPRPMSAPVIPRPPEPYVVHQYTLLQTSQVIGREHELSALDEWVKDAASARVLCLVAIGGMGKSALTWKWFHKHAPRAMQPLAGRFWWSFYESDAGFDRFVAAALAYCTGESVEVVTALSPVEREKQLLEIFDREPFLLLLDGLERILIAYANLDFAHLADEDLDERTVNRVVGARGLPHEASGTFIGRHRLRITIDPRAGSFLHKLSHVKAARTLVTTRLYPSELQTDTGYELPGTAAWFLRGMASDDARALWRAMGVSGSDDELERLFASIDYYPLLIRALAGEVARYRRAPGDFDAWRRAHRDFDPFSLPLVQAKSHVLAYALRALEDEARELLDVFAAFRSPVDYDTVAALFIERRGWPLQKLDHLLVQLEDRGLLGWDRRTNRYDLHPIVRGVVWAGLDDVARKAVYGRLEEHFASIPRKEEGVDTLKEALPAIELFNVLVGQGRYEEAGKLYLDRILFGRFVFGDEGMAHVNTAMLESLFADGLDRPPRCASGDVTGIYAQLGHAYLWEGRLSDAWCYLRAAFERSASSMGHFNLALVAALTGEMNVAVTEAHSAAGVRSRPDDARSRAGHLALTLLLCGNVREARQWLLHETGREYYPAFHKAAIEAKERHWQEAAMFAAACDASFTLDRLSLSLILAEADLNLGAPDTARPRLHDILNEARRKSLVEPELHALRLLAELHRRSGDFEQARAYLDDLAEPAARGPYRLIQADAFNVLAEIERDCGNREAAIEAAHKAYERAWCDGPEYTYFWGLAKAKELLAELEATR